MLVLHTRIQSNCVSIQYSQSQFAKDTSSDTYLHSIESCYVTVQIISPVIVVPWKRRVSWLCVLWHIHEQFHFTYLWIQSTTLYSIWLVFSTKKHSVSSAKPPVHPLHTRTLIYAMCCLVWKQVLLYRASPSPFLSGRSFPRYVFFFELRQAWVHFCAEADRRAHLFLGTQWSYIPHTYFCANFPRIDSHLNYLYLLICIFLWIIVTYK
jgi:hypothetical protein